MPFGASGAVESWHCVPENRRTDWSTRKRAAGIQGELVGANSTKVVFASTVSVSRMWGAGICCWGWLKKSGRIVGTKAIGNVVKMREFIHGRTEIRVKIREEILSGKRIVVFEIPPRPSGKAYRCDGRYFTRIGQELMKMSDEELKKIHFEERNHGNRMSLFRVAVWRVFCSCWIAVNFFGFLERTLSE